MVVFVVSSSVVVVEVIGSGQERCHGTLGVEGVVGDRRRASDVRAAGMSPRHTCSPGAVLLCISAPETITTGARVWFRFRACGCGFDAVCTGMARGLMCPAGYRMFDGSWSWSGGGNGDLIFRGSATCGDVKHQVGTGVVR